MPRRETATEQRDGKSIRITCQGSKTIPLEELKGFQGNLKTINRKNLEKLKGRILKHGFNAPIFVWVHDGKNNLLDGHQRTRALLELQAQGYDVPPLPCAEIFADSIEEAKDKLLGIASQYGDFTLEGVRDFTAGIDIDPDLRLTHGELRLESALAAEEDEGDDAEPDAAPRIAKNGEMWGLGPHLLKCGSSTAKEDVAAVMGDFRSQLVFTDPPYGVDYDDAPRGGHNGGVMNDEKKGLALEKEILTPAFMLAAKHALEDAAFYIWHASATRKNFERAMDAAGLEEKQYIIWSKPAIVMGRGHYHWAHEPCFYAARQGITPRWAGDRTQPTVWQVGARKDGIAAVAIASGVLLGTDNGSQLYLQREPPKAKKARSIRIKEGETVLVASLEGSDVWEVTPDAKKDYIHPNQKPVALALRAIANNTEPGEVVYDAFTGSGSTLIACQRSGRIFRGLELDPRWIDRIIKRWCLWMFNHHLTPEVTRNGKPFEWQRFCPELLG